MNIIQLGRLFLFSMIIGMMSGLALKPQALFAQVDALIVTPVVTATPEPSTDVIDLTIDENHDGMPDELQAALDQLNAVYEAYLLEDGTIRTDPEAQAALRQATEEFQNQLPYSDQTRAAQARIAEIYQALTESPDSETQAKLLAELQALEVQLQSDSNFALIDQVLSRRLVDALNAKIEAGQTETPTPTATHEATPIPDATPSPTSPAEIVTEENALVQSAAVNQPGLQQWLANAWTALFPRDPCGTNQAPNWGGLTRGEIMFMGRDDAVPNFFYAKKYNHIGIYDGAPGNIRQVYEAWHQGAGVISRAMAPLWEQDETCVAFATVSGTNAAQRQNALNWAKGFYNSNGTTPYNFNFIDRNTNAALYCSQLVWKVFDHLGINLDSNDVNYRNWLVARHSLGHLILGAAIVDAANFMVAPDEIALDPETLIYALGFVDIP